MPVFGHGPVRIRYQEVGTGTPLLVIPGGGLNATVAYVTDTAPFDALASFGDEYRCIAADLRNAPAGGSSGPLETDRPWDAFTDDHLALMDHLGIDRFLAVCRT